MVAVVRGREVKVLIARLRLGVACDNAVNLAVQQLLFAIVGRNGRELDVAVAHARGHFVSNVDFQAVVLSRLLIEHAEVHDVVADADAQRALPLVFALGGTAASRKADKHGDDKQHGDQQRRLLTFTHVPLLVNLRMRACRKDRPPLPERHLKQMRPSPRTLELC